MANIPALIAKSIPKRRKAEEVWSGVGTTGALETTAEKKARLAKEGVISPVKPKWSAGTNIRTYGSFGGGGAGGSSANLSALRGAMVKPEDYVQQAAIQAALQATNAKSALIRQLQRYGINPNAQRSIAAMGTLGMQGALGKTQAMTQARLGAEGQRFSQLSNIERLALSERGMGLSEQAQQFRQQGYYDTLAQQRADAMQAARDRAQREAEAGQERTALQAEQDWWKKYYVGQLQPKTPKESIQSLPIAEKQLKTPSPDWTLRPSRITEPNPYGMFT